MKEKRTRRKRVKEVEAPVETPEVSETITKRITKTSDNTDAFLDEIYKSRQVDLELDHQSYVGPKDKFDAVGVHQFEVMKKSGLMPTNSLLDIGCGCMRGGKHLIKYLEAGMYHGIEPNKALLKKGIFAEIPEEVARAKKPSFKHNENFNLSIFDREFDFILAQSIFSHAAPDQIMNCLKSAYDVMTSGGKFVFNYIKGGSDYTGSAWVYPQGVKYTELKMIEYVRKAGFTIEKNEFHHPNGLTWIIAKKQ